MNEPTNPEALPLTNCSASLGWKQSGPEWQAEVHPEFQYVAMEIEGAWHAFLFLGSRYKQSDYAIATDFQTADDAKQKCQDHYNTLLPQNAIAQTQPTAVDLPRLVLLLNEAYVFIGMPHKALHPWRIALDEWQAKVEQETGWNHFAEFRKFEQNTPAQDNNNHKQP